jgi:chromosome segregation ATPase
MESLASGMKNLSDTAHKLSGVSDATFATDNYVGNLTKAAESVRNLSLEYDKTAHALSRDANVSADYLNNVQKASDAVGALATIYEETTRSIKIDGSGYNDQLAKLNQNLSSINTMYEMQLQNAQTILNTSKSVEDNLKAYTDNLHASLENTIKYKEEIDKLSKNVALLSNVYGNMLSAMNVNRG